MGNCVDKNVNNERDTTNDEHMDDTFNIRVSNDMWPEFDTDNGLLSIEPIFLDFTNPILKNWARGDDVENFFGSTSVFNPKERDYNAVVPELLFDLASNKVVPANSHMDYVVISHVWGNVESVDGKQYGVDWTVPVKNKNKIEQIATAARVMGGARYVWMDVLCLDQRKRNEREISIMGEYYSNAIGCIVWLDNAYNDTGWKDVLSAIEEVNTRFDMDKSGIPTKPVADIMAGGNLFSMQTNDNNLLRLVRKVMKIEHSPWFKRLWTLQEGIIPNEIFFCTPERYAVSGAFLFNMISLCAAGGQMTMDVGSIAGFAVLHELQKSEIWKMIRLRKLYRNEGLSYWNIHYASITRKSRYEQDRVFGMCGLMKGHVPTVDYKQSIHEINKNMYTSFVNYGDFSTCCFVGKLFEDSVGIMIPLTKSSMSYAGNTMRFDTVGVDVVTKVHCLLGSGELANWSGGLSNVSVDDANEITKSFGLPLEYRVNYPILPGTMAIMSCIDLSVNSMPPVMNHLGENFVDEYQKCKPKALIKWLQYFRTLKDANTTMAHIVIWTESSGPQLAAVEQLPRGRVVLLTPESYVNNPGRGSIVCNEDTTGKLIKIGVCFGNNILTKNIVSNVIVTLAC